MTQLKDLTNDTLINNIGRGLTSAARLELLEEVSRRLKAKDPVQPPDPLPLPELNADLIDILGRPNFACAQIADVLRADGKVIKERSEDEQAAVIHWMLNIYIRDPIKWREIVGDEFDRIRKQVNP